MQVALRRAHDLFVLFAITRVPIIIHRNGRLTVNTAAREISVREEITILALKNVGSLDNKTKIKICDSRKRLYLTQRHLPGQSKSQSRRMRDVFLFFGRAFGRPRFELSAKHRIGYSGNGSRESGKPSSTAKKIRRKDETIDCTCCCRNRRRPINRIRRIHCVPAYLPFSSMNNINNCAHLDLSDSLSPGWQVPPPPPIFHPPPD